MDSGSFTIHIVTPRHWRFSMHYPRSEMLHVGDNVPAGAIFLSKYVEAVFTEIFACMKTLVLQIQPCTFRPWVL